MKPYISIVIPMMRPGGLDVICSSLENQTFKDFELVIVDSIYEYRKDIVAEKMKQYSFKYKHIPPITNHFPTHAFSSNVNTGIVNVSGDVILFTLDYWYFPVNTLKKHADFHTSHDDNCGYVSPSKFIMPPSLKDNLPSYCGSDGVASFEGDYEKYVTDLRDGTLSDYMWSIYETEFTKHGPDPSGWKEIDRQFGYDPKTDLHTEMQISPHICFMQTESIKTKVVLDANGLNEDFNGAPNYQDIEFSHRLRNMFNFKFYSDNSIITYRITGGHNIIPKIRLVEEVRQKAPLIFKKYEDGSIDTVNTWSLAEAHANNQGRRV